MNSRNGKNKGACLFMKYQFLKNAGVILSLVTSLTLTGCSFQFSNVDVDKLSKLPIEEIVTTIDNADFKDETELEEMISSLLNEVGEVSTEEVSSDSPSASLKKNEFESASLVRVVDGDTIVVEISGDEYKVRLIGVDTPESVASEEYLKKTEKENTQEGKDASEFTKNLLEDYPTVYLQKDVSDTDKYDRLLRYVWLDVPNDAADLTEISTKMLNAILLREGIANIATYEPDTKYVDIFEQLAETERE